MIRTLGKSGIAVSAMGLGCWAIGGPFWRASGQDGGERSPMGWGQVDDAESTRAIHAAIDHGITLFDTSNNYGAGHSETLLGRALAGKRDQVTLATKFGSRFDEDRRLHLDSDEPVTPEFIHQSLEGSLRRLNTGVIDLYQFHSGEYPLDDIDAVIETLEALVSEGKIRWYGWSTDDPQRAARFAQGDHCAAVQFSFNVFMDNPEMLDLLDQVGLAGLNKHPLSSGTLTGKFHDDTTYPEDDLRHGIDWRSERGQRRLKQVEAVRDVLASGGRTMAQGALAYIWARSERTIPIPGFKNVTQALENARAMRFGPLAAQQLDQIDALLKVNEEA